MALMIFPVYEDCPFCDVDDPKFRAKEENTVLIETDNFIVVPTRGSFVPGYLLIVTKRHFINFGQLPNRLFAEFRHVHHTAREHVRSAYGPVITFEHGGNGGFSDRGGSCIEHAHMHIVPYADDPWGLVEPDYTCKRTDTQTWPQHLRENTGYIYLESDSAAARIYYASPDFPRQYLRRRLCARLGGELRDKWHYDLYPFEQKIAETVERTAALRGRSPLKSVDDTGPLFTAKSQR
jgi:diadenosine tetraphosphate (Ap4A) HIT family hydrolase